MSEAQKRRSMIVTGATTGSDFAIEIAELRGRVATQGKPGSRRKQRIAGKPCSVVVFWMLAFASTTLKAARMQATSGRAKGNAYER